MFHETTRRIVPDATEHLPDLAKKPHARIVGCWTVVPEHADYGIFDAPTDAEPQELTIEPTSAKPERCSSVGREEPVETFGESLKHGR